MQWGTMEKIMFDAYITGVGLCARVTFPYETNINITSINHLYRVPIVSMEHFKYTSQATLFLFYFTITYILCLYIPSV